MTSPHATSTELRTIESVLQMGNGRVLDFTNRSFAALCRGHGVDIYADRFCVDGTGKAKRLRAFLEQALPPLSGKVLAELLEHRLMMKAEGELDADELADYLAIVARLGGKSPARAAARHQDVLTEAELLARVFEPATFESLPMESSMLAVIVDRMKEAQRCVQAEAYLAAVIASGSVLEGMCLGYGSARPERANRAWHAQFDSSPKKLTDWTLAEWITVLQRLGVFTPNIAKFGHAVRDFRNYVHPAEQVAHRFTPDKHTARISFQVVIAAAEDMVAATGREAV